MYVTRAKLNVYHMEMVWFLRVSGIYCLICIGKDCQYDRPVNDGLWRYGNVSAAPYSLVQAAKC